MPRNEQDPAASTQAFRAFASDGEATRQGGSNTGMIVGIVVAVIVVIAVIAVLLLK